jgi:hypothetical protein
MRVSYFLHNASGLGRKIPRGEAWQWLHNIEDLDQAKTLFDHLKRRIAENRLTLANLYVDKIPLTQISSDLKNALGEEPVEYNEVLTATRIINKHEEFLDDLSVKRNWPLRQYEFR